VLKDRDFNEVELREMLEVAMAYRSEIVEGRFIIETRHRGSRWEVIVEPQPRDQLLLVITAYEVRRVKQRYLEVTFRKGKPLAAYLYLPRPPGAKSVRTADFGDGLLVDFAASGEPMGLEITAPRSVSIVRINDVLAEIGLEPLAADESEPLRAA